MQTQQCVTCKQVKPIEEFSFRRKVLGIRHIHCRDCQRIYKRNHYLNHRETYIKNSARQKEEAVQRNRLRVLDYLQSHPCVDCGETDIFVLEFDHIADKERPVAQLILAGVSWEKLFREIAKCEVRCANCHRRKTAKERGWYKNLGL
jgi:hypothetical protein